MTDTLTYSKNNISLRNNLWLSDEDIFSYYLF